MAIGAVSAYQAVAKTDTLNSSKPIQTNNTTNVSVWVDKTESAKEITVPTKKEVENYNKQEKIKKLESQIRKNEARLQKLESALAQDKITYVQYQNQMDTPLKKAERKITLTGAAFGVAALVTKISAPTALAYTALASVGAGIAVASLAVLLGIEMYKMAKNNSDQDVIRNAYQEEQAKLMQETEQLKAQLAELQNS